MNIQLLTPPSAEPITLAEAQLHTRSDGVAAEIPLMNRLIRSARLEAERITDRALVASQWQISLDQFPWIGRNARDWRYLDGQRIRFPKPPLISVGTVTYTDTVGDLQTLDPSQYRIALDCEPGIIEPAYATVWPVARYEKDVVQITYWAGWPVTTVAADTASGSQTVTPASMAGILVGSVLYCDEAGSPESVVVAGVSATTFTATFASAHTGPWWINNVPSDIRSGMLLIVASQYTNRELTKDERGALTALLTSNNYGAYLT